MLPQARYPTEFKTVENTCTTTLRVDRIVCEAEQGTNRSESIRVDVEAVYDAHCVDVKAIQQKPELWCRWEGDIEVDHLRRGISPGTSDGYGSLIGSAVTCVNHGGRNGAGGRDQDGQHNKSDRHEE